MIFPITSCYRVPLPVPAGKQPSNTFSPEAPPLSHLLTFGAFGFVFGPPWIRRCRCSPGRSRDAAGGWNAKAAVA